MASRGSEAQGCARRETGGPVGGHPDGGPGTALQRCSLGRRSLSLAGSHIPARPLMGRRTNSLNQRRAFSAGMRLILHGSALSVLLLTIPHLPKVIHHTGWALHQPTGNHTPSEGAGDNRVKRTSQLAARTERESGPVD